MRKSMITILAAASLALLPAGRAAAQDTVKVWTLHDCLSYALENNIELQQNRNTYLAGLEDTKEAKAAQLPSLTASTTQGFTNYPSVNASENNSYTATYGVNADSAYPEKAAELVAEMATPEMASLWMSEIMGQTGIKGGSAPAESEYLQEMNEVIDSLTLVTGPLSTGMAPEYINEYESVTTLQLLGEITVDEMIDRLEAARTAYAQ